MSDCRVPEPQGYDVARLRIEFQDGEVPWMYPLALNGRIISGVYVDGERYESVTKVECKLQDANLYAGIRMAQRDRAYERIAELEANNCSRWFELFGTPERAARTVFGIVYSEAQGCDDNCPLSEFCDALVDEKPPDDGGESALLEWLRGEGDS